MWKLRDSSASILLFDSGCCCWAAMDSAFFCFSAAVGAGAASPAGFLPFSGDRSDFLLLLGLGAACWGGATAGVVDCFLGLPTGFFSSTTAGSCDTETLFLGLPTLPLPGLPVAATAPASTDGCLSTDAVEEGDSAAGGVAVDGDFLETVEGRKPLEFRNLVLFVKRVSHHYTPYLYFKTSV